MVDLSMNERSAALFILMEVVIGGRSLTEVLARFDFGKLSVAYTKELCFGVLRYYESLDFWVKSYVHKPLKGKEQSIHLWLMMGLYQLEYMQAPPYAVVSEMVEHSPKVWARGLINAVLRNFLRQRPEGPYPLAVSANLPSWIAKKIQAAYPQEQAAIIKAMQQQAPLTLRVNRQQSTRVDYLAELRAIGIDARLSILSPDGLICEQAVPVNELPGFLEGRVSVQDESAQCAAALLALAPGMRVLDACAAPGGKASHLLENTDIFLTALDISPSRCRFIQENLQRLKLCAEIEAVDAKRFAAKTEKETFERILLDAPCSATGVIRRHPDIKLHRRSEDVVQLVQEQQRLLCALWPLLKKGGRLVYATCSLFPEENEKQIIKFLHTHEEALSVPFDLPEGMPRAQGWQLLPTSGGCDGFYYAILEKKR